MRKAQFVRLERLSQVASWTITTTPVTASQTQRMIMLLFSEAIIAKKIEPIATTRKITLDIQLGMEGIPTVRIFPARLAASISSGAAARLGRCAAIGIVVMCRTTLHRWNGFEISL